MISLVGTRHRKGASLEMEAGLGYLATAYSVFFSALFVYVMHLRARDVEMSRQLAELLEEKPDQEL